MADDNLFKKLTDLFRSGPVIKRKVKKYKSTPSYSRSSLEMFKKNHSDVYNSTLSAHGSYDRMARYSDFSEMEATPEISSALDIYSEETVSPDASGNILHICSENRMIKQLLEELFYDVINVDFNLAMWVRNLCKYGDFFLFNDVHPELGVVNAFPIPIAEMEREEGFDPNDPAAVRFRWVTQGNRVLENWQISHFRLLGNDAFLPYGASVLEGARRIWRQLVLIEDAMLVYRIIRSPERRVFYIDVGNIPPENVTDYIQQAQTSLKRSAVIDKNNGQVDLRYNPFSVDEDYFLPVRGGDTGTKIDTLSGGSNTSAIEDVEYIQKKLFAALKIPKAYLGYDEDIGAKSTLAQEDIRFSRTIQRIQKTIISELNKIAMIHLYSHGYTDESLLDFQLKLSNPSAVAQQQKLELIRTKFEIAGGAPEGMVDREWIRKNILDLTDDDIERINIGKEKDKLEDMKLENVQLPQEGSSMFGGGDDSSGGDDMGDASGGDAGGDVPGGDAGGDEGGLGGLFAGDYVEGDLINEEDDEEKEQNEDHLIKPSNKIKVSNRKGVNGDSRNTIGKVKKKITVNDSGINVSRIGDTGLNSLKSSYNTGKIEAPKAPSLSLKDSIMPQSSVIKDYVDDKFRAKTKMDKTTSDMLANLNKTLGYNKKGMLNEDIDLDEDILIDVIEKEEDSE